MHKLTPAYVSLAALALVAGAAVSLPSGDRAVARTGEAVAAGQPQVQVPVVERADWGAVGGRGVSLGQVDEVIIHHFWKPSLHEVADPQTEADLMQQVERTHMDENDWSGFGYNFVVFQSGRVYEGRGWGRVGAHTVGENDRTVGIAFAIDGDEHEPTPEAWAAAKALIEDGAALGHVTGDATITGHGDYAPKSCPGRNITPQLATLAPDA